jgi:hypothetical protein
LRQFSRANADVQFSTDVKYSKDKLPLKSATAHVSHVQMLMQVRVCWFVEQTPLSAWLGPSVLSAEIGQQRLLN